MVARLVKGTRRNFDINTMRVTTVNGGNVVPSPISTEISKEIIHLSDIINFIKFPLTSFIKVT